MYNATSAVLIWMLLMLAAVPYVRWIKHGDQRFFAAYLIFVAIVSAVTAPLYLLTIYLIESVGGLSASASPTVTAIVLTTCSVIAIVLATRVARLPPMRPPSI